MDTKLTVKKIIITRICLRCDGKFRTYESRLCVKCTRYNVSHVYSGVNSYLLPDKEKNKFKRDIDKWRNI